MEKRIHSLDVLRGFSLMLIILFHSSIYNYANIHKIDFDNPPIIVVIMSFMALWGGIFIVYSAIINTIMLLKRIQKGQEFKYFSFTIFAGLIYLTFHYLLNIFLGRWNNDFVNNMPDMTVVAASLRRGVLTIPMITKYFEGSSLSTIALNLIFISLGLYYLLRNNGIDKQKRNYLVLWVTGFLMMVFSFIRVPMYSYFTQSIQSNRYFIAVIGSFIIANPYPLIPYLAYGIFGSLIGLMYFNKRYDLIKKILIPTGIAFLIYGLMGMSRFEKSISKPDYFWYFKTQFELGVFLLLSITALIVGRENKFTFSRLNFLKWFSRISLTIYMLETSVSEIFRLILLKIYPLWNQTINGSLIFGGLNIILWIILLLFWKKSGFRYSLEYFWVLFFKRIGKDSSKMNTI